MDKAKDIESYIQLAPETQHQLLNEIYQLVKQTVPDVTSTIKWGFPVFSNSKDFAYLRSNRKYVTLGFTRIDHLKDPEGLLEGEGKTMRHIKITSIDEAMKTRIKQWLSTAALSTN
jgi:hypothetical protein